MKILGINILSSNMYYCVLEGTKENPVLLKKEKCPTLTTEHNPELMDWFETTFVNIIKVISPDKISYRQLLGPKKAQQYKIDYPYGILNLLAYKNKIDIIPWVPQNFVPSKLNLPQKTNLLNACDDKLGNNPPYWNKDMKNAVLAAWMAL
ncbi:MAG: hypothetical protein BKP49_10480 [Treponema sp. CETP13]|nr:MAG: hypothetical protein BKP49_10480 [Treponema sp. CETP13]